MMDSEIERIRAEVKRSHSVLLGPDGVIPVTNEQILLAHIDALEAVLTEIASHEIDKRYWPDIADHAIAQDCEQAHEDLRALARKALEG